VLHVYVSLRQAFHSHPAAATDNYPYWLYLPWLSLSRHSIRVSLARNWCCACHKRTHALAGCVFYCTRVDSDDVELPPAKAVRVHPVQPHQGRQSSSRHRPGPKSVTSPQNEEEDPRLNRVGASASHQWIQEYPRSARQTQHIIITSKISATPFGIIHGTATKTPLYRQCLICCCRDISASFFC